MKSHRRKPVIFDTQDSKLKALAAWENGDEKYTEIETPSPPPGGGGVESVTVTLTDEQIKALPTTYIEIVPAQGVGKLVVPITSVINFNFTASGYTNVNAGNYIGLGYGNWDVSASGIVKMFSEGLDDRVTVLPVESILSGSEILSNSNSSSVMYNAPLKLFGYNVSDGDFTGGNAANTLKVTVYYVVVDL